MKPRPSPIQAEPRIVEPIAAVVGARVLESACRTKASGEGREEAAEQPDEAARLRAEEREQHASVHGGRRADAEGAPS